MSFKVGDKVSYLDDVGTALIKEINGLKVLVEDDSGFDKWLSIDEIVLSQSIEVESISIKDGSKKKIVSRPRIKERGIMEKDLHIHELIDDSRAMTNYQMLNLQMIEAEKALKKAKRAKAIKLIFIHGVGEGKLRSELHQWLSGIENISFYDASFLKYGAGATEVDLW
tara:strand:+ start:903 stop:1406 length:504 start_codon:yes stop_codon:yes gene_type:complete